MWFLHARHCRLMTLSVSEAFMKRERPGVPNLFSCWFCISLYYTAGTLGRNLSQRLDIDHNRGSPGRSRDLLSANCCPMYSRKKRWLKRVDSSHPEAWQRKGISAATARSLSSLGQIFDRCPNLVVAGHIQSKTSFPSRIVLLVSLLGS
jgi:hypothetical protein